LLEKENILTAQQIKKQIEPENLRLRPQREDFELEFGKKDRVERSSRIMVECNKSDQLFVMLDWAALTLKMLAHLMFTEL